MDPFQSRARPFILEKGDAFYTLNGIELEQSEAEIDLGVKITRDCKSSEQCGKAACSDMIRLGILRIAFKHIDIDSFKKVDTRYVHLILEYAVQSWSPCYRRDIQVLERVQNPWSAEVLITGDTELPLFDEGDDGLNLNYCRNRLTDIDSQSHLNNLSTSSSTSDEFYMEGEDDCFLLEAELASVAFTLDSELPTFYTDSMVSRETSTFSEGSSPILREEVDNWSPATIPEGSTAFTCTTLPFKSNRSQHSQSRQYSKKWSQMSKCERLKKVEDLSSVISSDLGLREQMDIIKIINPKADIANSDTEFVIDLEDLNDKKLERIENIVNFHCSQTSESDLQTTSDRKFSKKNRSQDRRPCSKVPRRRIQKEHKQRLKEQRSGLFVKEERLAVSTVPMEEEIDVLG